MVHNGHQSCSACYGWFDIFCCCCFFKKGSPHFFKGGSDMEEGELFCICRPHSMNNDMKWIWNSSKWSLPIIGWQTIKSKKWRFSVVAPVYRGIEPLLAPAWDWTLDPMPPSTQAGNLTAVPLSLGWFERDLREQHLLDVGLEINISVQYHSLLDRHDWIACSLELWLEVLRKIQFCVELQIINCFSCSLCPFDQRQRGNRWDMYLIYYLFISH